MGIIGDLIGAVRRERAQTRLWRSARTLADLGDLTARWLAGEITHVPGYSGGPDEETASIRQVLIDLNRAGLVTHGSQPGESDATGWWAQRAAVEGFIEADSDIADALVTAGAERDDIVVIVRGATRWRTNYRHWVPVTKCGDSVATSFGATLSRRFLRDTWTGYGICSRHAQSAVCDALQVTVIDLEWGRPDVLWPWLLDIVQQTRKRR